MSERIDEKGKWLIENGIEMLIEPSDLWKQNNPIIENPFEIKPPSTTIEDRVSSVEIALAQILGM